MSSAARTAGKVYKEVTIAGKKFRLSQPKRVGLQGDIEAFILSRKDDPIVIAVRACQQAPKDMHATIWDAAIRVGTEARIVTSEDWKRFEVSPWSTAFMLWKCLDPKHTEGADATVPDVESAMALIMEEAKMDEIMANVAVVSQDVDLKNSSGPTTPMDRAQDQSTASHSSPDGQPSISTSPNDSDSTTNK